ncbi:imidazole glycerol phosphate synthase subunit HisH [Alkalimarinus alittae]|uniref:Imidazole glycerol phosphate synthase subunit HisH n=1 Tax=Alkalimarinus alittae TaxID=2961619 RepID=A0ABY6N4H5_9ALTE|nr:imidazole glycerol phosphate synthase subunit HisH [Alkalimarinus alittae]UZE97026.1 imidazole glycerol phosphate synthase subunit HisH [Alkalimarinus alittae]
MNTVAVIDYGMGNLHSVSKAIEHVAPEAKVIVTSDASLIREADRVVLPGVGAIRDCMAEIQRLGVDKLVREVSQDRPFLGICVGMQALMQHSEENNGVDCIGLLPGRVKYFGDPLMEEGTKLKVPHMGWNKVRQVQSHPLWQGINDDERFYFVHSFYVAMEQASYVMGRSHYGKSIDAAVGHENIFAVQFHPEKSQHSGLALLKNFVQWNGRI